MSTYPGISKFHAVGLLWLRVFMGVGIAYHGYGKVFGGHMDRFAQGVAQMGLPYPEAMAWASALSEFLGGICIVLGFQTSLAAFFVFCNMSVAVFLHHANDIFAIKELALAYWTVAGALILTGGGPYTLDSRTIRLK